MKISTIIIIVVVIIAIIAVLGGVGAFIYFRFFSSPKKKEGIETRYIRLVAAPEQTTLHLAELEAYDTEGKNVALGKPVSASTVYANRDSHASGLTDGITDGGFSDVLAHTEIQQPGTEVWFEVDLGEVYPLKEIKIYNRTDCCWERANHMVILLLNDKKETIKEIKTGIWTEDDKVKSFSLIDEPQN